MNNIYKLKNQSLKNPGAALILDFSQSGFEPIPREWGGGEGGGEGIQRG